MSSFYKLKSVSYVSEPGHAETLNFAIDFLGVSAGFCINNRELAKIIFLATIIISLANINFCHSFIN